MTAAPRPALDDVRAAVGRQTGIIVRTPLVPMRSAGDADGILLKPENHQVVGSFKLRGVLNAVAAFPDERRRRGLSTVSAGNTAQALAWCGRHFGVSARSIMPDTAPRTKIEAVRGWGGEPVLVPVAEVFRFLREHRWEQEPFAFVHPWTNREVMTGHGTMGLEIFEDRSDVETVFIPVGGGGLLGGVAGVLKQLSPSIRIVAVEPTGCPSLHESLRRDRPVAVDCHTICDGVAVPYMTEEMFPVLKGLVDEAVLVSDDDVRSMVRRLALHDRMVVEPSGALAAAAAIAVPHEDRGCSVCLVTGGSRKPAAES